MYETGGRMVAVQPLLADRGADVGLGHVRVEDAGRAHRVGEDRVGIAVVAVGEQDDDGRDERQADEDVDGSQRSRHRGRR